MVNDNNKTAHHLGARFCNSRMLFMVGTAGIEPVTLCMSSIHSNQLSYAPALIIISSI